MFLFLTPACLPILVPGEWHMEPTLPGSSGSPDSKRTKQQPSFQCPTGAELWTVLWGRLFPLSPWQMCFHFIPLDVRLAEGLFIRPLLSLNSFTSDLSPCHGFKCHSGLYSNVTSSETFLDNPVWNSTCVRIYPLTCFISLHSIYVNIFFVYCLSLKVGTFSHLLFFSSWNNAWHIVGNQRMFVE